MVGFLVADVKGAGRWLQLCGSQFVVIRRSGFAGFRVGGFGMLSPARPRLSGPFRGPLASRFRLVGLPFVKRDLWSVGWAERCWIDGGISKRFLSPLIPAKAGIHCALKGIRSGCARLDPEDWIPTFVGMSGEGLEFGRRGWVPGLRCASPGMTFFRWGGAGWGWVRRRGTRKRAAMVRRPFGLFWFVVVTSRGAGRRGCGVSWGRARRWFRAFRLQRTSRTRGRP